MPIIIPTADAYLGDFDPDVAHGGLGYVLVGVFGGDIYRNITRINATAYAGRRVLSVAYRRNVIAVPEPGGTYQLGYPTETDWVEAQATFNEKYTGTAWDDVGGGTHAGGQPIAEYTGPLTTGLWDATSDTLLAQVQWQLDNGGDIYWMEKVDNEGGDDILFQADSRTGTIPPQLRMVLSGTHRLHSRANYNRPVFNRPCGWRQFT